VFLARAFALAATGTRHGLFLSKMEKCWDKCWDKKSEKAESSFRPFYNALF